MNHDRSRWLAIGLVWTMVVTISRSLRWPCDWAEAQWLLGYQFGFMKRGLPGALLQLFYSEQSHPSYVEWLIGVASYLCLGGCWLAALWLVWRIIECADFVPLSWLIGVLFLTSPFWVMLPNLNGFFDSILLLLSVLACVLVMRRQIWSAALILGGAMLIHESILLLGVPSAIFVACISVAHRTKEERGGLRALLSIWPLVVVPLFCFGCLAAYQNVWIDAHVLRDAFTRHLATYPFIEGGYHKALPEAMTLSFTQYFRMHLPTALIRLLQFDILAIMVPGLFLLCFLCWRGVLRHLPGGRWLLWLWVGVVCAPMSLHLIASDTIRIWSYSWMTALLAVWGVFSFAPKPARWCWDGPRDRGIIGALCCVCIGIHMVVHIPLLNVVFETLPRWLKVLAYGPVWASCAWLAWGMRGQVKES